MKTAIAVITVALFAVAAAAQTPDLSTDEAVLAAVQKRVDADRAAAGKPPSRLNKRDVCIRRIKDAPAVVVIGFFAYDRGCALDGAFVDGVYIEKSDKTLSQKALAAMGWEKAGHIPREEMALMWVEKGLLAFASIVYEDDKEAPIAGFHRPEVVTPKDGPITVTLWTQRPSGMRNEKASYQRMSYRFTDDGSLE